MLSYRLLLVAVSSALLVLIPQVVFSQRPQDEALVFPPRLPNNQQVLIDDDPKMLEPPAHLRPEVLVAKTAPRVAFAFYPGQDYPGNPWSNWGDGCVRNGKYYSAIGDHRGPTGNAFVYEYDPARLSSESAFRKLVDLKQLLGRPEGHYVPGKIHSRLDVGSDGWLYFSTHRGSPRYTTPEYHYEGDWILRCNPQTGEAQVVVHAPVGKHCIPCSVLDPSRMIFYGGTAAGQGSEIRFFAYDILGRRLLCDVPHGPPRYMILALSTGRVYYTPKDSSELLMRFDPAEAKEPVSLHVAIGVRAATHETPQGIVYTVSQGERGSESSLYEFNTKTETARVLGSAAVGQQQYIASLDADPTGRYLYYVPGAHGGSTDDGSPIVQYDTRTGRKKVLAFLHPYFQQKYGLALAGTYSTALDERGERLFITWNVSRGSRAWDCCAVMVVEIPASERP